MRIRFDMNAHFYDYEWYKYADKIVILCFFERDRSIKITYCCSIKVVEILEG